VANSLSKHGIDDEQHSSSILSNAESCLIESLKGSHTPSATDYSHTAAAQTKKISAPLP